jgi:hypothetical protein
LLAEVEGLAGEGLSRRTVERFRGELRRIEARGHAAPPERDEARRAVEGLVVRTAADGEELRR